MMFQKRFHNLATAVLLISSSAVAVNQQPLGDDQHHTAVDVIHELKKAEIIPTVIDDFLPLASLSVSWKHKTNATLGNTAKPKKLQNEPNVGLSLLGASSSACRSEKTYVITLTDPDAPSRENPEWSEMCHWIASGVPSISGSESSDECALSLGSLEDVMPYKAPGPPPKTGKHRYVFVVFAPRNGTTEPLHLSKPKDRQHWGFDGERHGVRDWAGENGLVPIAANFLYAKNKKQ